MPRKWLVQSSEWVECPNKDSISESHKITVQLQQDPYVGQEMCWMPLVSFGFGVLFCCSLVNFVYFLSDIWQLSRDLSREDIEICDSYIIKSHYLWASSPLRAVELTLILPRTGLAGQKLSGVSGFCCHRQKSSFDIRDVWMSESPKVDFFIY